MRPASGEITPFGPSKVARNVAFPVQCHPVPHNGRVPFDSSDSRRAAEFDSFRRELVLRSRTVAGDRREAWFERLKELVSALFPDATVNFRKPGLATRLFSAEVELPGRDKMHLLDLAQELDDNWKATYKEEVKGGASCVYLDRLDGIWEWVLDLGDCYVSGHVKLRNFSFTRERTFDKSRGPSHAPQGSERPFRRPGPDRKPFGDRHKGGPPFGKGRPGPGRPRRRPSDG